jgi:prolyl oligopeptidase PreP (S9A serine peptidase family)
MTTALKDLDKLHVSVEAYGMRISANNSFDDLLLTGADFLQKDGTIAKELAIGGCVDGGYLSGYVPLVDVLKFAMQNCPELVADAMRDTGTAADIVRMAGQG